MRFPCLLFFMALCLLNPAIGQEIQYPPCGADKVYQHELNTEPGRLDRANELNDFIKSYVANKPRGQRRAKLIIPVVIHIIHDYGEENISKAQVLSAINVINKDFPGLAADTAVIKDEFKSIFGRMDVEFRLARLDPDGNCTEGITRTASQITYDGWDSRLKDLVNWNTSFSHRYMQVWVVNTIEDAGGFANFPNSRRRDGIVVRHTQFGALGTSNGNFAARTLTHEIGHYLALPHTWGGGESGAESSCNGDDGINDTPNTKGNPQSCNKESESCGSLDNVENYMDYAVCIRMFTKDQVDVMDAALHSSAGGRSNLWSSANLQFTGTNDGFNPGICEPIADFRSDSELDCQGVAVKFFDLSYNFDTTGSNTTWEWTFAGGTPSTSTEQNPIITYENHGTYDVALKVTNDAGSDTYTRSDLVNILSTTNGFKAPLVEGMENSSFPKDPGDPLKDWTIEDETNYTWERTTRASSSGNASMVIENPQISEGINSFVSPSIDTRSISSKKLTFKAAYAKRTEDSNDRLKVYVSKNCGKSWTLRWSKSGDALATNGGTPVSGSFTPDADEWVEHSVNLSPFESADFIRVKFECTSDRGNNLYVDDININGQVVGIDEFTSSDYQVRVFPNPVTENTILSIQSERNTRVNITINDLIGKRLGEVELSLAKGDNRIPFTKLASINSSGVYIVTITDGKGGHAIKRISKN